jgi:2-iminobutanoate/2-iminopropanoate deaminase
MVGDGDAPEQARQCLRNLEAIAAAGGGKLTEALQVTVYTTRLEEFPAINEAYAEFFEEPPPARVTIGVSALPKGALVEVSALVPLP